MGIITKDEMRSMQTTLTAYILKKFYGGMAKISTALDNSE